MIGGKLHERLVDGFLRHSVGIGPCLIGLCLVLTAGRPAGAIEIEATLWGFDGQVVLNRFNMLSVLVSNYTPVAFDGTMVLEESAHGSGHVGAPVKEPCYLSPGASRWIQFHVYVINQWSQWRLVWGTSASQRYPLPQVNAGGPARVFLVDSNNRFARGGKMKRFDASLFPTSVTGTGCLEAVVLDDVPRWGETRRTAFLEWLRLGGTVHILKGSDGRFPILPPELADLNTPADRTRVGTGWVFRHPRTADEMDQEFVATILHGPVDAFASSDAHLLPSGKASTGAPTRQQPDPTESYWASQLDMGIFGALKDMRTVSHSWPLIYCLCLLYLLCIFPGCYLLGRKRLDYRLTYAALVGVIVLFSYGFAVVGRRGYGESMTVNSVAIARQISEGAFNVVQWSDAFVTRGDDYEISHSGSGRIYSTCQENEAVKGDIRNGPEGVFTVDIPPFSSRTFGHCMRLQDAPLNLQLVSWQTNETGSDLETLVVSTGPQFPKNARRLRALFRAKVYDMSYDAGILELKARSGSPLQDILSTSDFTDYVSYRFGFRDDIPQDERYERLLEPLLAQSLNVQGEQSLASFSLPDDRVRLCVYAPMPDGFYLKNDLFGKQAGYVLYCVDLMRSTGG